MVVPYVPCSDEEYFKALVTEAPYLPGWHTNTDTLEDIEWLDRDLLEKSKDFFIKHRIILSAITGVSALYGVQIKNLSLPFIATGTLSLSPEKTAKRTVKHVSHFVEWFSHGVGDPRVYSDLQKIKRMHTYLTKSIQPYTPPPDESVANYEERLKFRDAVIKDFGAMDLENEFAEINTYSPPVYLSQFDMVMIQMDLVAAYLFPELHAIEDKDGLDGFMHHWAIIGRLLGVDDRFNLALHPSKDLYLRIARNALACMSTMDLTLSALLESHLTAIALYFHIPASNAGVMYAFTQILLPSEGFKGEHLWQIMSYKDRVVAKVLTSLSKMMYVSDLFKGLARFTTIKFYGLTSRFYHKMKKEDRINIKMPLTV